MHFICVMVLVPGVVRQGRKNLTLLLPLFPKFPFWPGFAQLPLGSVYSSHLEPVPPLPDRKQIARRKHRMRSEMDAKWMALRDYAPVLQRMQLIGPTNPIEAQLLRETLQLVLAELNFKAQETAELTLLDFDLETEGPDEPGRSDL